MDLAVEFPLIAVTDKPHPPAGGTLHDFASMGPYWWPDPAKPDGLPYIRRDGYVLGLPRLASGKPARPRRAPAEEQPRDVDRCAALRVRALHGAPRRRAGRAGRGAAAAPRRADRGGRRLPAGRGPDPSVLLHGLQPPGASAPGPDRAGTGHRPLGAPHARGATLGLAVERLRAVAADPARWTRPELDPATGAPVPLPRGEIDSLARALEEAPKS